MVKGLILYPLLASTSPDHLFAPCDVALMLFPDFRIFRQLIDLSGQTPPNGEQISEKPMLTLYWMPEAFKPNLVGLGECNTDQSGRRLTFVRVRELKRLVVPEDTENDNKAIIARVTSLPEKTPVILYWV